MISYIRHLLPTTQLVLAFKDRQRVILLTVLAGLCLLTLSRGFRLPSGYVTAQWLFNYDNGFIKRGMVGTMVSGLFHFRSPHEIVCQIQVLSIAVLAAWALALLLTVRWLAALSHVDRLLFVVLPSVVFFSSPFIVQVAYWAGYFDRLLELLALVAVVAISRERFLVLPFISMLAISIHEVFVVYGFPVVCFVLVVKLAEMRRQGRIPFSRVLFFLLLTIVPSLLFYGSVMLSQIALPKDAVTAIERDIFAYGIQGNSDEWWVMFHLKNDILANWNAQRPGSFLLRVFHPDFAREIYPSTAFLFMIATVVLIAVRRASYISLLAGAVLTPLLIHLVAWDTPRFSSFTTFNAYLSLVGLIVILKPKPYLHRFVRWTVWVLFLVVLVVNFYSKLTLDHGIPEESALFASRQNPTPASYSGKPRLFHNSDFDLGTLENWTVHGDLLRTTKPRRDAFKTHGQRWYGTYNVGRKTQKGLGDAPRGYLLSVPFTIEHDTIIFLVSGGKWRDKTYVALEVEGKEVYRNSGADSEVFVPRAWDVSAYRGKEARIRVVDRADGPWGHVNVDAFYYWP